MRRRPLKAFLTALAFALPLALAPFAAPVGGASVVGTSARTTATVSAESASSRAPAVAPRTYRNPLAPRVPGDGSVDSCADPTVLRGQQPGDRFWYLYCTTDPLNDEDLDAEGNLRFHPVPMMRSRDLVNWTYVGDALPTPPEWAAEGAGLWAPDVVYSKATGRYYLTFVVTDTDDSLRGPDACASAGDSAIGVAVSDSPTGPWDIQDEPLVAPRPDPEADCSFFWTFDPDVLGDAVARRSVLYFGSYYGGIYATRVAFDANGAHTVGTSKQVTIGNRYEGANVVHRGGWYYLFGSATNCCNGPLTSYGVYSGRSRSPMGPFVDREGVALTAGRVGGTPTVLPNGNKWVGVGHNSVFTDASGRWWTIYHAVDRFDPYFATDPGFTKRPALLDQLTWRDGWPSVRAGRWASASSIPAPAVRPGQHPATPRPPAVPRLGRELARYSDDFAADLDPAWSWVREPDAATYGVERGAFRFDTQAADLFLDENTASVLTRPGPIGDYVVQARVKLDLPAEGCCQNFVQAGLVVYDGDDAFVKLVHASIWETRQTEWAKEIPTAPAEYPRYGNGVVGPPGDTTWLRVVVQRTPYADRFTAWTSDDGRHWVRGGTWRHDLGDAPEIGLVSMAGAGFTARFLDVRVWRLSGR